MTAHPGRGRPAKQSRSPTYSHYITYHGRNYRIVFHKGLDKALLVARECIHTEVAISLSGRLGQRLISLARQGIVSVISEKETMK